MRAPTLPLGDPTPWLPLGSRPRLGPLETPKLPWETTHVSIRTLSGSPPPPRPSTPPSEQPLGGVVWPEKGVRWRRRGARAAVSADPGAIRPGQPPAASEAAAGEQASPPLQGWLTGGAPPGLHRRGGAALGPFQAYLPRLPGSHGPAFGGPRHCLQAPPAPRPPREPGGSAGHPTSGGRQRPGTLAARRWDHSRAEGTTLRQLLSPRRPGSRDAGS